ncbi:MAG: hypothetical protein Q9183_006734 [Haloplaca sp. 2 TL-2023]
MTLYRPQKYTTLLTVSGVCLSCQTSSSSSTSPPPSTPKIQTPITPNKPQVLNHYIHHLNTWWYDHVPDPDNTNTYDFVTFLNTGSPPWQNDTVLRTLDMKIADIVDAIWDSNVLSRPRRQKDNPDKNLDQLIWWALGLWEKGTFLEMAREGGLLHAPLEGME